MAEMNYRPTDAHARDDGMAAKGRQRSARGVAGNHQKKKNRVNLFDLIVIALIVLVVVLLVVGVRASDLFGAQEGKAVRLSYTVTIYNVDEAFAQAITVGDAMYDVESKLTLGTVKTEPSVTPYQAVTLESGKAEAVAMKNVPDRVNVTLTMETSARYVKGVGYMVGGRSVRIGEVYAVRFPSYVGSVSCVAINGAINTER